MRAQALVLSLSLLPFAGLAADDLPHYVRPINIITSDYDQLDTTYIDRGRLDGVHVGDHLPVRFRDGKQVATVVVTAVFDRMASVKIEDSWLLKNGQLATYKQRPMVVELEPIARRQAPAPEPKVAAPKGVGTATVPAAGAGTGATPQAQAPGAGPAAGVPAAPGVAAPPDDGLPATPDAGLPATPGSPAAPNAGSPAAPASPSGAPAAAADSNQNIPPPPE